VARLLLSKAGLKLDEQIALAGSRDSRRGTAVRLKAHVVSKIRKFQSPTWWRCCRAVTRARRSSSVLHRALRSSGHRPDHGRRQYLQRRHRQRHRLRHPAGAGARLQPDEGQAAASGVLRLGHREEKGLLGLTATSARIRRSRRRRSRLDLNYDAIATFGVPEAINVTGADRTSFFPTVEKTAKAFHYEIEPDANPGAGHYYRSDHFSSPASACRLSPSAPAPSSPAIQGVGQGAGRRLHHQPLPPSGRRVDAEMDFASNAALARYGFALGWQALLARTR